MGGIFGGVAAYSGAGGGHGKKMLFCRVLLGEVGPGQSGLRRPPEKHPGGPLYDSVGTQVMDVVFDNDQAYPEYVVHY